MATIPGSQFTATAPGQPVNVVETGTGAGLPAAVPGAFNLEVFVGFLGGAPTAPATGYQGLAILSPSGLQLDLISGVFAVTDNGSGNDTLNARGDNQTISGGAANVTLNLFGTGDVAIGGGQDTISVYGNFDTVNGGGDDLINVYGTGDAINGGPGDDTINVFNSGDTVAAGSGNEQINLIGSADTVVGGSGNDTINLTGDHFSVTGGSGSNAINALGDDVTINGGPGNDTIVVSGFDNEVRLGTGSDTVFVLGGGDTVLAGGGAGANSALVNLTGADNTLDDGPNTYFETVVGFDQTGGDRIHLTTDTVSNALAHSTPVNGGQDTLITLNDGSTLLLKGVAHIDNTFFS